MLNNYITNIIGKRHVAGPYLYNAEKICQWASVNGCATTISVWTHPHENKKSVAEKYINIINSISYKGFDSYLSIKPSALQFDLDLFESIAREASDNKIRIHFDSLSPDLAGRSLQYFKQVKTIYNNVGYTLPARWLRSLKDAEEIVNLNVPVRIVKGQWQDPLNFKINIEENFLKIIEMLINKSSLIAIATHDLHLAKQSVELLNDAKVNFELEQFFSLPMIGDKLQKDIAVKVRLYVAYGQPYLPYNLKAVAERPAMINWFVRDLFNLKRRFDLKTS